MTTAVAAGGYWMELRYVGPAECCCSWSQLRGIPFPEASLSLNFWTFLAFDPWCARMHLAAYACRANPPRPSPAPVPSPKIPRHGGP